MLALFNSLGIASLLCSLFAFRFGTGKPKMLGLYFVIILTVEWFAKDIVPEGAFGVELGILCFNLTAIFFAVMRLTDEVVREQDDRAEFQRQAAQARAANEASQPDGSASDTPSGSATTE